MRQEQTGGLDAILDGWDRIYPAGDDRWLAYALATAYHETDRTMQPIPEYGRGRGSLYGLPDAATGQTYYGRGLVQLTWKDNYEKATVLCREFGITGVDLVNNADDALRLDVAVVTLLVGMARGIYTGRRLGDYFSTSIEDWYRARRVINALDHAGAIAKYGRLFLAAMT